MVRRTITVMLVALVTSYQGATAQDMLVATKVSQRASVTQRVGTTDITVVYHSPQSGGRKIFGGIVPYDFEVDGVEYPWRAGSNQNTTIEFTHDVKVQGQSLSKGKYGLHIFVEEEEWTWIFSSNAESWGSFAYKKEEDALRVKATPAKANYQDWLSYRFVSTQPETSTLELQWTDVRCGIEIAVDVTTNVLADLGMKEEKTIDDYVKLAQLTLKQDPSSVDEAMAYVNQSFEIGEEFRNKMLLSELLMKKGQKKESRKAEKEAIALAKGFPYYYYYALRFMLLEGNAEKTFEVLTGMLEKEPDNYPANLAMGEYYIKMNNQEKATHFFKRAYESAGERSKNYTRYMYLSNKLILENQD